MLVSVLMVKIVGKVIVITLHMHSDIVAVLVISENHVIAWASLGCSFPGS